MSEPSAADQVQFLTNLQKLLSEGTFTASYKFALLLSLADLCVETTGEAESILILDTRTLAEKFIQSYWRQTFPYATEKLPEGRVLHQNTNPKKEAAIISIIKGARVYGDGSLAKLAANKRVWNASISRISRLIEVMPLWKLQTMAGGEFCFLYPNQWHEGKRGTIALFPGVAFYFRRFYELVQSLIKDSWLRYVRKLEANRDILGQTTDLEEFLFGSERQNLDRLLPILAPLQEGACFYCNARMVGREDVDHFIPWSKYPVDLAHNFVLSHRTCNADKSNHLPALQYLERWIKRNTENSTALEEAFNQRGLVHNLKASLHVARWAYEQAELSGASLWVYKKRFCGLEPKWRNLISYE